MKMRVMDAITKATSAPFSVTGLANHLDVAVNVVSNWKARGRVPTEHCPDIEAYTNGAVRCEELRPDVNWQGVRNSRKAA